MKLSILYQPNSESARKVEEYAHDFQRQRGHQISLISLETREGADLAKLYDIVHYPAILATKDNGELINFWSGDELPLMNEVAAYIPS